ncbi:MAG TPA: hypothetical protein VHQ92_14950 [Pseudolabrys sp.]|jgi:hypothetical protein|nr:hypothetical protein [Pseudolabrys sp.]
MMRAFEIASIAAGAVAAVCWFLSARVKLTKVGFGLEELDKVTALSEDLQKMARWNFWAAAMTALAVALQVLAKMV